VLLARPSRTGPPLPAQASSLFGVAFIVLSLACDGINGGVQVLVPLPRGAPRPRCNAACCNTPRADATRRAPMQPAARRGTPRGRTCVAQKRLKAEAKATNGREPTSFDFMLWTNLFMCITAVRCGLRARACEAHTQPRPRAQTQEHTNARARAHARARALARGRQDNHKQDTHTRKHARTRTHAHTHAHTHTHTRHAHTHTRHTPPNTTAHATAETRPPAARTDARAPI
jgi:hypothetical protein